MCLWRRRAGRYLALLAGGLSGASALAADATRMTGVALLDDPQIAQAQVLPDYSYAGYHFGLRTPPVVSGTVVDVRDYGAVADDEGDDSQALLRALAVAHATAGPVIVQLPPGRLIISEVLRIQRGHFVLRGSGSGAGGSELYFPRPLKLVDHSHELDELRDYLRLNDKRQVEPKYNINAPFSEYSWSGGFVWVQPQGSRPASYLEDRDPPLRRDRIAQAVQGQQGKNVLQVNSSAGLNVGQTIQIRWFNRQGRNGALVHELYGDTDLEIGSRLWSSPKRILVTQETTVESIDGNKITLGDPLLHDAGGALEADIAAWPALEEVGIEDLALVFPNGPSFGHHLELGYNGIYLTGMFNGWVRGVRIENADSGILTYDSANLSLLDVTSAGQRRGHYSVHIGSVHNVLVSDLKVFNPVVHPLSVNTLSTRNVFLRAEVFDHPGFDQHAGANHQNLFDQVTFHVQALRDKNGPWYPIWDGSGAPYWQPGHARFNTTWNLRVLVQGGALANETVRLVGADEGPAARVVGISGNRTFQVDYRPAPYIEAINQPLVQVPSLYEYQLEKRRAALPAQATAHPASAPEISK